MSDYKGFHKEFATVYTDELGQHRLMLPEGIDLPHIVRTVIVDDAGDPSVAVINFMVNLVPTKSDALMGYGVKTLE